jgi:hypothetical protein
MAIGYIIFDHPSKKLHIVGRYTKNITTDHIYKMIEKNFPLSKNEKYIIINAYGNIAQYKTINEVPISKKFGNFKNVIGLRVEVNELFDYDSLRISSKEKTKDSKTTMQICTLTGKRVQLPYSSNLTIAEVLYLIHEIEGIPIDQMRLVYSGKQLERNDEQSLENHNISHGSTLYLLLRLRGGMFMEATSGNIDYNNMENVNVDIDFDNDFDNDL